MISQRQFAPKCSFLASRPLRGYSFRISWQISKFYKFDFYDFITLGLCCLLALGFWSLPSHCLSGFRRCQCQCHCRDQFLFAPSIPVAARTIVLITNPLTACFFSTTVFLPFDFRGVGGESSPCHWYILHEMSNSFFMHIQQLKQHINILFYLKICLKPQRSNFIP